ncbi:hypothetical protein LCGC14_2591900 [marine sediment metagenome]|uniref:Uncharacterized protein n=1 Tax=marine sediment metagenome TaxID=412755 RepID=A0A0F9ABD4_9ZZZZ
MHTYVKLKNGEIWILWSDNVEEETMHVYPLDRKDNWDVEWDKCTEINYSDIEMTDTNLVVLQ